MLLLYTYVQVDSALMHKQNMYRSVPKRAISAFMARVYLVYVGPNKRSCQPQERRANPLIAARAVNMVDWPNMRFATPRSITMLTFTLHLCCAFTIP
jgi:hypothetical protein